MSLLVLSDESEEARRRADALALRVAHQPPRRQPFRRLADCASPATPYDKNGLPYRKERIGRRAGLIGLFGFAGWSRLRAQFGERPRPKRLPNGRNRDLLLIKADHEKTLEEVGEIRRLSVEIETALEQNTEHVVDLESIEKLERIESLAKSAHKRMRRIY